MHLLHLSEVHWECWECTNDAMIYTRDLQGARLSSHMIPPLSMIHVHILFIGHQNI